MIISFGDVAALAATAATWAPAPQKIDDFAGQKAQGSSIGT
jgi:hypothetical protein